jgi:hypothetical protein
MLNVGEAEGSWTDSMFDVCLPVCQTIDSFREASTWSRIAVAGARRPINVPNLTFDPNVLLALNDPNLRILRGASFG